MGKSSRPKAIDDLVAEFSAFDASDDEYANTDGLEELVARWRKIAAKERPKAVPAVFGIFESHPGNAEMGAPGPLVHALETMAGYEEELVASLRRAPSYYGLWMANRILNGKPAKKLAKELTDLLRSAAGNPSLDENLRDTATDFLEHQEG
jgi:hypothetical protein